MNDHPCREENGEEWKYLLKLRRYITGCKDIETMGRGVLSDEELLKHLYEGYWLP